MKGPQEFPQWLSRNPQARRMLEQLLEARHAAEAVCGGVWPLAVEKSDLLDEGGTLIQLRLLVWAGCVDHAEDVSRPADAARRFKPESRMTFGPRSCFILSDAGHQFLTTGHLPSTNGHPPANGDVADEPTPFWDADARELRVGPRSVKRFDRPAPVLELVLAAFQEMAWPQHLDDPLPPKSDTVSGERLRDTIRRLNRCQMPHLLRFASNGCGTGIRWGWKAR